MTAYTDKPKLKHTNEKHRRFYVHDNLEKLKKELKKVRPSALKSKMLGEAEKIV